MLRRSAADAAEHSISRRCNAIGPQILPVCRRWCTDQPRMTSMRTSRRCCADPPQMSPMGAVLDEPQMTPRQAGRRCCADRS
jgi:hypothetical protein